MPKRKSPPVTLARPRTVATIVSHPRLSGEVERVERVVYTLEGILRRARVKPEGRMAAERYANAREVVYGQAGGACDFDRVRSGTQPGSPPLPSYLKACEIIREAKYGCLPLDYRIIDLVVGNSLTIREVTEIIYKTDAKERREFVGLRLRAGLSDLARQWHLVSNGELGSARIVSIVHERAGVTDAPEVERGAVFHSYRVA